MKISFKEVERILKTLPISYYTGYDIPVELSETEKRSYIDLFEKKIVIAYPQLSNLEYSSDSECDVRSTLYHEISHALLTPIIKKFVIDKNVVNIFEDERIECLLKDNFMGTDFRGLIKKISPLREPKSKIEYFFNLIRHRVGPPGFNEAIDKLIEKYRYLNASSSEKEIKQYQFDIKALYGEISSQNFSQPINLPTNLINNIITQTKPNYTPGDNIEENLLIRAYKSLPELGDLKFRKDLEYMLRSIKTPRGINSASKLTNSGHIRPKAIAKPDTGYKWFTKQGDGFIKNNKKIRLNIFADCSGSFKKNEKEFNSLLYELYLLEKKLKTFEFKLACIEEDKITLPSTRVISCGGENSINSDWKFKFLKLQSKEFKLINLFFFDGFISTINVVDPNTGKELKSKSEEQYQYLAYLNKPSSVIISDQKNKSLLNEYCPSTVRIYTDNYLEEFKSKLISILHRFLIS